MKQDWYISYSLDEVIIAPEAVAASIVAACRRSTPGRVAALLQQDNSFTVVCSETDGLLNAAAAIRFVEVTSADRQELTGMLNSRWQGGYHAAGMLSDPSGDGSSRWFLMLQKFTRDQGGENP